MAGISLLNFILGMAMLGESFYFYEYMARLMNDRGDFVLELYIRVCTLCASIPHIIIVNVIYL